VGVSARPLLLSEHAAKVAVGTEINAPRLSRSYCGSIPMWKALIDEAREVAWLALVVGSLSAAGVGLAVVVAAA
jgi:hypothetical protein